jgi:hypothetical protein
VRAIRKKEEGRRKKEEGQRRKSFFHPSSFLLLPFIVLATANSAGYRYGASDQAFYASAVMQRLEPALFPRDTPLLDTQARLTLADDTVAAVARVTGRDLPSLFAALYVLTLAVLACAVLAIGGTIYRERWAAVALLAAVSLRHGIAKSGTNTLEGYFHPRQLAFALGLWGVYAFIRGRYLLVLPLLAGAAVLHPTTTLWFAIWLSIAAFVAEPRWRAAILWAAVAVVPVTWWALAAGPLAGRLVWMDPEWLAAIADKDYLFPLQWPAYAWALNLGCGAAVLAIWRKRRSAGLLRDRETALVAGCLSLVVVFAAALAFQSRAIALAVQLQPARVFWMTDFLAVVYLVWLLAEGARRPPAAVRAAVVAGVLTLASIARGLYIMHVEFPDRPLAEIGIRNDDWGRTMAWARSTDLSTGWLAHPLHAARYGTSVRVAGARDVFVEALKDSALGMYDRAIAIRTRDRIAALRDFDRLTATRARELGSSYSLDFLVTDAALELPVAFQSGSLSVYRLR